MIVRVKCKWMSLDLIFNVITNLAVRLWLWCEVTVREMLIRVVFFSYFIESLEFSIFLVLFSFFSSFSNFDLIL